MESKNCLNFHKSNLTINYSQNVTGDIFKFVTIKFVPYITVINNQDRIEVCGSFAVLLKEYAKFKRARFNYLFIL